MGKGKLLGNPYETLRRGNLRRAGITSSGGGGGFCDTPYHSTRLKLSQAPGEKATYQPTSPQPPDLP